MTQYLTMDASTSLVEALTPGSYLSSLAILLSRSFHAAQRAAGKKASSSCWLLMRQPPLGTDRYPGQQWSTTRRQFPCSKRFFNEYNNIVVHNLTEPGILESVVKRLHGRSSLLEA